MRNHAIDISLIVALGCFRHFLPGEIIGTLHLLDDLLFLSVLRLYSLHELGMEGGSTGFFIRQGNRNQLHAIQHTNIYIGRVVRRTDKDDAAAILASVNQVIVRVQESRGQ